MNIVTALVLLFMLMAQHDTACGSGVSINWVAAPSSAWSLAGNVTRGSAEVTLAASGRKAGTNKNVSS